MTFKPEFIIRDYRPSDEPQWLECRVLALLQSAYFDDVRQTKETYSSHSIELIAVSGNKISGLLDIAQEERHGEIFGMIWHLATHPEYRRLGIASRLIEEGKRRASALGIARLEAWTRDDGFVNDWYRSQGFRQITHYYHIHPSEEEVRKTNILTSPFEAVRPITGFLHYYGDNPAFLQQFSRVHECRRYDLVF